MINCTRLLCSRPGPDDGIRYAPGRPAQANRPVVVWTATRRCNLRCMHCYMDARPGREAGELTTAQATAMIDDLAAAGAPVLLFSGGEPLMRDDVFQLGLYAARKGLRTALSTNGTLITKETAARIRDAGFSYAGISLDGLQAANDRFRRNSGAFKKTLEGIRNCRNAGVRTGLRFTINKHTFGELAGIFALIEREGLPRACFYHLVYSGRASSMVKDDLTARQTRGAMDLIFERCVHARGAEILTVDNHADGVYLYLGLKKRDPARAAEALRLLRINGGNKSGIGIANVDDLGFVHADQFWGHYSFGNVKEKKFSAIWSDESDALLRGLRNRAPLLKGKCSRCNFKDLCGGNFRVRAETVYQDVWQEDPACYLTEEEVSGPI